MYQVIIVIHVLLGLGIIGLVLIQQGKGADAGAAFGTGTSGSVFGAQGAASFLSRSTATLAALFFSTSLGLAVLNSKQGAAYDLMNPTTVKQDSVGIPQTDNAKPVENIPVAPIKPEEKPVIAPSISAIQPSVDVVKRPSAAGEEVIKAEEEPKEENAKATESKIPASSETVKSTGAPKADATKPAKENKKKAVVKKTKETEKK